MKLWFNRKSTKLFAVAALDGKGYISLMKMRVAHIVLGWWFAIRLQCLEIGCAPIKSNCSAELFRQ